MAGHRQPPRGQRRETGQLAPLLVGAHGRQQLTRRVTAEQGARFA